MLLPGLLLFATLSIDAELGYALRCSVAGVSVDFVPLADDLMSAVALAAAAGGSIAVFVARALAVAVEEVGAFLGLAATRKTLEVKVAKVIVELLAFQAGARIYARTGGATKGSLDTIVVILAIILGV